MTDLEKAKEWLGSQIYEPYCAKHPEETWDELNEHERKNFVQDGWQALVAIHGDESAKILLSKWSDVKGGEK